MKPEGLNVEATYDDERGNFVPQTCPACAAPFYSTQSIDVVRSDLTEALHLDGEQFRPRALRYARCHRCRSIIATDRRRTVAALAASYEGLGAEYWEGLAHQNAAFAQELMTSIPRPSLGGELWDIGCGDGALLEALRSHGSCHGIEPGAHAVDLARKKGLDVLQGTASSLALVAVADVVVSVDVVEHLDQPVVELEAMFRMLKPGGWVALVTGVSDSLTSRIAGNRWYYLHCLGHVTIFSRTALQAALARVGFSRVHGRAIRHPGAASPQRWLRRLAGNAARWALRRPLAPVFNFGDHQLVMGQKAAR